MNNFADTREPVILLHGLAETSMLMLPVAAALNFNSYKPVLFDYPSTRKPIEILAMEDLHLIIKKTQSAKPLHFITHSMGGIILRYYLNKVGIPNIGRIVMMAPGNKGSATLSFYKNFPFFYTLLGPAAVQSGDDEDCFSCAFSEEINAETGIIAGSLPLDPISIFVNQGPHDGKVSVESTKLKAMKDHITLSTSHDFMMCDPRAIYQAMYFLRHGQFNHRACS